MRFISTEETFPAPMQIEVHLLNSMSTLQFHETPRASFLWNRVGEAWASGQYAHSWFALANAYQRAEMFEEASRCQQIAEALLDGGWFTPHPS